MKHLVKNTFVLIFSIFFILLTVKSSYAEVKNTLLEITPTSNKTVELKFENELKNKKGLLQSDLEVYRSIENSPKKDEKDLKKIILDLKNPIEENMSYSLISISGVEGSIIFKTGDEISNKEIQNSDFSGEEQGIKSILIKDKNILELKFLKNIDSSDLEFQLYKTIEVDKIAKSSSSDKVKVLLKNKLKNNGEYLGTLTYLETSDLEKITIEKGIYYFSTKDLKEFNSDENKEFSKENGSSEKSLEDTLMNALNDSKDLNNSNGELLDGEKELKEALNSASEDPENREKSQLEKLALGQKQTPDSGAETWVLLLGTFILNTLYFMSRRKKSLK